MVKEHAGRVLVSHRGRTRVGALLEADSGHTTGSPGVGAVNRGRVLIIRRSESRKEPSAGVCGNESLKDPVAVKSYGSAGAGRITQTI